MSEYFDEDGDLWESVDTREDEMDDLTDSVAEALWEMDGFDHDTHKDGWL